MRTSPTRTETERPTKPEKMESEKETKRVCFLFNMLITKTKKKETQSERECYFLSSNEVLDYLATTYWPLFGNSRESMG